MHVSQTIGHLENSDMDLSFRAGQVMKADGYPRAFGENGQRQKCAFCVP